MISPAERAALRIGMGRGPDGDTPRKRRLDARILGRVHGVLFGLARDGRRGGKSVFLFGCLKCGRIVRRIAYGADRSVTCGRECPAYASLGWRTRSLDEDTVRDIRSARSETRRWLRPVGPFDRRHPSIREIARRFGLPFGTVADICRGVTYRSVE